jgi:hypothetical protein
MTNLVLVTWSASTEERNKFLNEQYMSGKGLGSILAEFKEMLADKPTWSGFDSPRQVTNIARAYAKRHGLPIPTRRNKHRRALVISTTHLFQHFSRLGSHCPDKSGLRHTTRSHRSHRTGRLSTPAARFGLVLRRSPRSGGISIHFRRLPFRFLEDSPVPCIPSAL